MAKRKNELFDKDCGDIIDDNLNMSIPQHETTMRIFMQTNTDFRCDRCAIYDNLVLSALPLSLLDVVKDV